MHPADFNALAPDERRRAAYRDDFDGPHWKVVRVAELMGVDADALDWEVEAERGWEPHDDGYLHTVVNAAAALRRRSP